MADFPTFAAPTKIQVGQGLFNGIGGAVNDLFSSESAAEGLRLRSRGNLAEAGLYDESARLSRLNEEFTRQSTEIQQVQTERNIMQTIGKQQSDVAGSGFAASGTALDLLRSSAQQGALTHQLLGQQGLITEAGQEQQAHSYDVMAGVARDTASTLDNQADNTETAGMVGAGFKAAGALASLFV